MTTSIYSKVERAFLWSLAAVAATVGYLLFVVGVANLSATLFEVTPGAAFAAWLAFMAISVIGIGTIVVVGLAVRRPRRTRPMIPVARVVVRK